MGTNETIDKFKREVDDILEGDKSLEQKFEDIEEVIEGCPEPLGDDLRGYVVSATSTMRSEGRL